MDHKVELLLLELEVAIIAGHNLPTDVIVAMNNLKKEIDHKDRILIKQLIELNKGAKYE